MRSQFFPWYRSRNTDLAREIKHQIPVISDSLPIDVPSIQSLLDIKAHDTNVLAIKQSIQDLWEALWGTTTTTKRNQVKNWTLPHYSAKSFHKYQYQKTAPVKNKKGIDSSYTWFFSEVIILHFGISYLVQCNIVLTFLIVNILMRRESHCPSK